MKHTLLSVNTTNEYKGLSNTLYFAIIYNEIKDDWTFINGKIF